MQKILEDFFNGNIDPCDGGFPPDPEYKTAIAQDIDLEKQLMAKLNKEEKDLYECSQLAFFKRSGMENTQLFVNSFRLGARMMLEILTEE